MTPTPKRTNAETVAEFEEKFPLASKCTWNDGIYKNDPFHDVTAKDWLLAALEAKDREREAAVKETWEKVLCQTDELANEVINKADKFDSPYIALELAIRAAAKADGHDLTPEGRV